MNDRPKHFQAYFDSQAIIFTAVDQILDAWTGSGCYKMPILLEQITEQFGWDDKTLRCKDPVIRDYLRNHPNYFLTRGAHGGIGRRIEKQKKDQALAAKEQAKAEVNAAIEAELRRKQQARIDGAAENTNTSNDLPDDVA